MEKQQELTYKYDEVILKINMQIVKAVINTAIIIKQLVRGITANMFVN